MSWHSGETRHLVSELTDICQLETQIAARITELDQTPLAGLAVGCCDISRLIARPLRRGQTMRNFFWPTKIKPEPNMLARIGRLIHWLGAVYLVLACLWSLLILGVLGYQIATRAPLQTGDWIFAPSAYAQQAAPPASAYGDPVADALGMVIAVLVISSVIYLGTRAIRYVLAGE